MKKNRKNRKILSYIVYIIAPVAIITSVELRILKYDFIGAIIEYIGFATIIFISFVRSILQDKKEELLQKENENLKEELEKLRKENSNATS